MSPRDRAKSLFADRDDFMARKILEFLDTPAGMFLVQPEPFLNPAGKYFKRYCCKRAEVDAAMRCLRDSPWECYVDCLQTMADNFMYLF
jgi:hypothetical protein